MIFIEDIFPSVQQVPFLWLPDKIGGWIGAYGSLTVKGFLFSLGVVHCYVSVHVFLEVYLVVSCLETRKRWHQCTSTTVRVGGKSFLCTHFQSTELEFLQRPYQHYHTPQQNPCIPQSSRL